MARKPSKITKRDIDKDLYLEIVNEASNEANVQELLDEYVRKDEGISEWQIPTKYRQNLSKRLKDLDTGLQEIKNDKSQQDWNEKIQKRLQTLEKKEGLQADDDGNLTPIIGTQVAANTSNISQNSKQISVLQGQMKALEQKHDDDKLTLQTSDQKLENDFSNQFRAASDRMSKLETSIVGKRDRTELVTEDDLDESVKKNIRAVLNIGDSTIEALDNLDGVIKRIESAEQTASTNTAVVSDLSSSIASMKATMEADISNQIASVRTTEQNDVKSLQTNLDNYKSENDMKVNSLTDQVSAMNSLVTAKDYRIDTINDKVENIAVDEKNNAINIAGIEDRITELGQSVKIQKQNADSNYQLMARSIQNAQKYPQLAKGKLLLVGDSEGGLVGTDLVFEAYAAYGNSSLKKYLTDRLSPIYDLVKNRVFVDISTDAKDEKKNSDKKEDTDKTNDTENVSETASDNAEKKEAPVSDDSEKNTETHSENTTTLNTSDVESGENASATLEANLAEDSAGSTKMIDAMEALSDDATKEGATSEISSNMDTNPSQEGEKGAASENEKESDAEESVSEDKKDGDVNDASAEEKEEAGIMALAKNYQVVKDFSLSPENFNTFLFDKYHHALYGYIDGAGTIHDFGTYSASDDPIELTLQGNACASFYRNSAAARPPVHVLVKDDNEKSPSHGRWINSEGVITVAYDDDMFSVFNNSEKEQQLRIIGG